MFVVADDGLKSDAAAEGREIVSHDGGGGSQREHHASGEHFPLRRQFRREAVKNQIEIEFTRDGDVEFRHCLF
jgi:hypothetical protein